MFAYLCFSVICITSGIEKDVKKLLLKALKYILYLYMQYNATNYYLYITHFIYKCAYVSEQAVGTQIQIISFFFLSIYTFAMIPPDLIECRGWRLLALTVVSVIVNSKRYFTTKNCNVCFCWVRVVLR